LHAADHAAHQGFGDARVWSRCVLHGANYDEAYEESLRRSQAEHLTFVHAFDDDAVIAGQGTIGWNSSNSIPTSKPSSSPSAAEA
jgi:threonine dehydratase